MTDLIIWVTVRTAPLLGGLMEFLERKKMATNAASRLGFHKIRHIGVALKEHVTGVESDNGIYVSGGVV